MFQGLFHDLPHWPLYVFSSSCTPSVEMAYFLKTNKTNKFCSRNSNNSQNCAHCCGVKGSTSLYFAIVFASARSIHLLRLVKLCFRRTMVTNLYLFVFLRRDVLHMLLKLQKIEIWSFSCSYRLFSIVNV